ncbi:Transmembrane protein 194 [Cynara cardunculus var. scolymus]|uniref:Transmembrane protein 194 n=1 Tax=Cynara cardunculus var. scolymus TaxID=59895 RepID=A0A103XMH6_CYNCS|nr:Transmembrane protein 194 [Cynara cardunculus var. scolymus]
MVGDAATSLRLQAALLLLLLVALANSAFFVVSGELPSLTVAEFASLQLSPSLVVEGSPGSKPGSQVICERVEINGLSRLRNLTSFFSSVKVKVLNMNSTGRPPNITVCFHRNASLGVGMCPEGQWEKLTKGSWVRSMSPFDHKLLDIRITGSSVGTVEVLLSEEFYLYRLIFLVLGITLMTFASSLSNSLVIYYGGAMTLGILLVVLVVLFQVGVVSFLTSYIPTLLRSLLLEMGIEEDLYNPVAVFLLACVVLTGAWLGFWAVRKLVLTEDGSIDTGVAQFVAWSFRIVAASMILQSSVDPLLAVDALMSIHFQICRLSFRRNKNKHRRSYKPVSSPAVDSYEHEHKFQRLSDSNTFYSSFHDAPDRKHYSKDEWDEFTKESTKKALESLVCSPDFSRWAVDHADRITLLPKKDTNRRHQSWLPWS